jgi:hypothetical protein
VTFNNLNRGVYRKTYPFNRSAARTVVFASSSADANRMQRQYDYFFLPIHPGLSSSALAISYGVYEEGLIYFDHHTSKTITFSSTFATEPIITLSVEGTDNVNVFVVSASNSGLTAGTSAELSGTVRYRAVYGSSYPIHVMSGGVDVLCSATSSILVDASDFVVSFADLGALPGRLFLSTEDYEGNMDANVQILTGSVGTTYVSGSLSAMINNRINFIALAT